MGGKGDANSILYIGVWERPNGLKASASTNPKVNNLIPNTIPKPNVKR